MKVLIKLILFKPLSGDLFANQQIKTMHKSILKTEIMTSLRNLNKMRRLIFIHPLMIQKIKIVGMYKLKLVMEPRQPILRRRKDLRNLKHSK